MLSLQALSIATDPSGPGGSPGPDQSFQCPNAGYFCATVKLRPYGMTSYALQSPISPLISFAPEPSAGGGGGGGGGGGRRRGEIAKFYSCSSSNARSVLIAQCPQNECIQGYCAGGGPANVPRRLRGGDGLYCGRTIIDQIGRRPRVQDVESASTGGGSALEGGGGGRCVSAGRGQADYCETPPGRV
ncbi:hypothetical protein BGZ92_000770 [Podila epicladia]|nr:hypothetical protein BGZ92_000770 [Podila epicladia]